MSRKGFDIDLSYKIETSFGEFDLKNVTTWVTDAEEDVYFGGPKQNFIGDSGTPEWRSQFVVNYSIDNLAVNWTMDMIADTAEDSYLDTKDGNPENFRQVFENHNTTYVVHNLNVKYFTENYGTVTVGARNLFDKGVVLDDAGNWVNDSLYNAGHIGREVFAGYSISF